jgi:putative ABC transport system permease protein
MSTALIPLAVLVLVPLLLWAVAKASDRVQQHLTLSPVMLVFVNLSRNKLRTLLTTLSVAVALFLFSALGGVLDTISDSIRIGSETRIITRNAIALVFPLPLSYLERLRTVTGVRAVSWSNWFGGRDPVNPRNFFPQFAVDAGTFFPMYANDIEIVQAAPAAGAAPPGVDPKLASFFEERTACAVGEDLLEKQGWKLGQTIRLNGTIYPGSWAFTIRAVYRPKSKAFYGESMYFDWKYLYENSQRRAGVGVYYLSLDDPGRAADIAKQVDLLFENSSAATHTESEQAFQAGFISYYGNLPFVIRIIGLAVVFAILLVAANTMAMAVRERTAEVAVLKTLGFSDGTVFRIVLAEGALITLGGGLLGALLAKLLIDTSGFNAGGLLPPMRVHWSTVMTAVTAAGLVGAASGLLPAWQASRMRIVDALRRVE